MKIAQDGYEMEINVDLDGKLISVHGHVSSEQDDGDKLVKGTTSFAFVTTALVITRSDVLSALYKLVASAAAVFGPMSDEVDSFEDDIDAVKNGGPLAPYAWMFEQE